VTDILHIRPVGDLVGHDTSTSEPDCVCGPEVRPEKREDGSVGWLIVHHELGMPRPRRGLLARTAGFWRRLTR
jgi:hypothetical protein